MNDPMLRKWHDLLGAWAVDPVLTRQTLEDISNHYAEQGRFYHTLEHVQNVLATLESIASHARNLNAVQLAAWLHDVIYDRRAPDNEERSAEYAERLCEKLSIPDGRRVANLILKTKTHDAEADPDAQVLLDADLAILGASEPVYRTYADNIRLECSWVPEPEYRSGRRQILAKFLARAKIFHFLHHLEEAARRNISAEIAQLAP
jgi:predicted metal-dependent HD superfamily phosphohydrolase